MIIRIRSTCVVLLILGLCSCGSGDHQADVSQVSDDFKTFLVDTDSPPVPFTEAIEAVEVVRLEETDSALLDYSFRISFYENKLVFPSGREGDVYVYGNRGEYISKFNRQGDGPEEYSDYNGIWMSGDTVMVFNHGKRAIQYYDLKGNHLKALKLDDMPAHITSYNDAYWLDMTFAPFDDSLKYRLMVLDGEGERQAVHLPYEKVLPFPVYSNISSFARYKDYLTYQPAFQDTIYLIKPDEIRPLFSVDFNGKFFWDDESLFENGQAAMNLIGEREEVWIYVTHVGPEQIFLTYNVSFSDYFVGLIDRASGKFTRLDMAKNLEEQYAVTIIRRDGDRFLFSLPSTDAAEFLNELNADQVRYRAGTSLEVIESSENPALMWVKFKP